MKLFFRIIAAAAKAAEAQGSATATSQRGAVALPTHEESVEEVGRLLDVIEAAGLVLWHKHIAFTSGVWANVSRTTLNVNWGGYGSRIRPTSDTYFSIQHPGDTVIRGPGHGNNRLVARKGARPLDACVALVLPEADPDGLLGKDLERVGAVVHTAGPGLSAAEVITAAQQQGCNFICTSDDPPAGLGVALDELSRRHRVHVFALTASRLRPFIARKPRKPAKPREVKPRAFEDREDAAMFRRLKMLLLSQDLEDIHQGVAMLPALPTACDVLLAGITLEPGIEGWTNEPGSWAAGRVPWNPARSELPCRVDLPGGFVTLAEVPRNEFFSGSGPRRYALLSVIAAAPEKCAAARAIREGLKALHWRCDPLPPLGAFRQLRHLALEQFTGDGDAIVASAHELHTLSVEEVNLPRTKSLPALRRLDNLRRGSGTELLDVALPQLSELRISDYSSRSPPLPKSLTRLRVCGMTVDHARMVEALRLPHWYVSNLVVTENEYDRGREEESCFRVPTFARPPDLPALPPVTDRGQPLPLKELKALKKLLREDQVDSVVQGLAQLRASSIATLDALFEGATLRLLPGPAGSDSPKDGEMPSGWGVDTTRIDGPFFGGLKRSPLGNLLTFILVSMAPPGCSTVDEMREPVKGLGLSLHDIPVNVSGFRNVQSIALTGAPAFMQDGWISGLDRLPNLRAVYLNMNPMNMRPESASPPAQPLTIPEGVVELTVVTELSSLAWLSLPSTLKTLSVWSRDLDLETLGGMRGLRPENLESLEVHTKSPRDGESRPPVDLSGLARFNAIRVLKLHMPNIASLDGVGAMPRLRKLQVATSVLKDIEAVRTLIHLEYFSLIYRGIDRHDGDSNTEFGVAHHFNAPRVVGPISIAPLTALPKLVWVNTDLFTVADVDRLADFSPRTDLRLRNILREAPQVPG